METSVVIRQAVTGDAAELARLNEAFNGVCEAPTWLAARLADPQRVETPLVAELAGRLVGFAALRLVPCVFYPQPHAELTELYVEPAYRRRGIGRALVAYAIERAAAAGASELVLLTGPDNHVAQALYRSLGFGNDDLALHKELT